MAGDKVHIVLQGGKKKTDQVRGRQRRGQQTATEMSGKNCSHWECEQRIEGDRGVTNTDTKGRESFLGRGSSQCKALAWWRNCKKASIAGVEWVRGIKNAIRNKRKGFVAILRTLAFTPRELKSHWGILRGEIVICLHLNMSFLATVLGIDKEGKNESWWLQQCIRAMVVTNIRLGAVEVVRSNGLWT